MVTDKHNGHRRLESNVVTVAHLCGYGGAAAGGVVDERVGEAVGSGVGDDAEGQSLRCQCGRRPGVEGAGAGVGVSRTTCKGKWTFPVYGGVTLTFTGTFK